jgi:hypothetical protein
LNIVKIIDDKLIKTREEHDLEYADRERNGHYPSSASIVTTDEKGNKKVLGSCMLAEWRKWKKVPETNPYTPDTLQKFTWGDMFHDWVTKMLEEECLHGTEIHTLTTEKQNSFIFQVPGLQYPVRGRLDNIVNKTVALEIKSSFGKFFFGKDNGLLVKGPRDSDLMQTLCYLKALPNIEYAILLYLARDIGFKVQYNVYRQGDSIITKHWDRGQMVTQEYPEITWNGITRRWNALELHLSENKEPQPDFKYRSQYPCSYCSYHDLCYSDHPKKQTPAKYDMGQNEEA